MRGWEMHAIRVTKDLEMRCSQFGEKINEFRVESLLTAMARPIWCGKNGTGQVLVWYMGGIGGAILQSWAWISAAGVPGWTVVN